MVAIFTGKMLKGEDPTIFGDGEQLRDYVFIEDVVRANLLAMRALESSSSPSSIDDQAYNIGTGVGTTVNELYAQIKEITGFKGDVLYGPERVGS